MSEQKEDMSESVEKSNRGETILIAEDETLLRDLLSVTLSNRGYQTLSARDSEEALELAATYNGRIDLLLADVVMPQMSGTKLYAELRKQRPALRALFISGYSPEVLATHCVLTSSSNFLAKPFSLAVLESKLRQLLR